MNVDGWSLVRFLHVAAAMGWVGGQLMLSGVILPVLREELEPRARVPLVRATAARFARISNRGLLPTLLVTGTALALHRNVRLDTFAEPGYGRLLGIKLVLVAVSIVLAVSHGAIARGRPSAARPAALGGLATSLGIVVMATALVP